MDYILFHSQYSSSSKKLLEEFPSLFEKSVSVDSKQIRMYLKDLAIVSVPTLVLILHDKIVDRIIGYENIINWLHITIYRTEQIRNIETEYEQEIENNAPINPQINVPLNVSEDDGNVENITEHTSLDDLVIEDLGPSTDEKLHITRSSGNTNLLKVAEELKKQRDSSETLIKRI